MEKEVLHFFESHGVTKDTHLLLACSGGPDSMALAFFLAQHSFNFDLAVCDFQLRPESKSEVALVEKFAADNQLQVHVRAFDTYSEATLAGLSIQEVARKLRYDWFEKLKQVHGYQNVLTAHHQLDQAETVLWNMIRGAGIDGLSGMQARRDYILRPFLGVSKNAIEDYLKKYAVPFKIDSSNLQDKYTRNNIRLHVMPRLQMLNAGAVQHIANTADTAAEAAGLLQYFVADFRKNNTRKKGPVFYCKIENTAIWNITFLHYFFKEESFSREVLKDIAGHIHERDWKGTFKGKLHLIELKNGCIYWVSRKILEEAQAFVANWTPNQILDTPFGRFTKAEVSSHSTLEIPFPNLAGKQLCIRTFRAGDRIRPKGMHGLQKVKKIFSDAKISNLEKALTPIVKLGDEIIWVAGHKCAEFEKKEGQYIRFEEL